RQQQHGGLLVPGQPPLIGVLAYDELLAGHRLLGGLRVVGGLYGLRRHLLPHAALDNQSRTMSAACLGFSSTSSPTVFNVCACASPSDLALSIQAGRRGLGRSASSSSGGIGGVAAARPGPPTSALTGSA